MFVGKDRKKRVMRGQVQRSVAHSAEHSFLVELLGFSRVVKFVRVLRVVRVIKGDKGY
jgi:hypothetical protein